MNPNKEHNTCKVEIKIKEKICNMVRRKFRMPRGKGGREKNQEN